MADVKVKDLEIVEELKADARPAKTFLEIRRLRCRNRREDNSTSEVFPVEVINRPRLDAVAVLIHRRQADTVEVLLRQQLRPAAYFRKDLKPAVPEKQKHLFVEEIVAGLIESSDDGLEGVRRRGAEEVREEAGFDVPTSTLQSLGHPFFVAPGILSEKIHLLSVDVTALTPTRPEGDGSPLEEGSQLRWVSLEDALGRVDDGSLFDAKTEIALRRFRSSRPGQR